MTRFLDGCRLPALRKKQQCASDRCILSSTCRGDSTHKKERWGGQLPVACLQQDVYQ